jgi:hypothetical protein
MTMKTAGSILLASASLALAGCGNSVSATAMVTTIDRTCSIVEKRKFTGMDGKDLPGSGQEVRTYEGECHEVDDWDKVKRKREMNLKGKAEIHLVYAGPDGKQHNGSIKVTGQDSEFYDLKAGDSVDIRLDPEQPERIWFS